MSKPRRTLSDLEKEQLKSMSGLGMPKYQMAAILGMSEETLELCLKRDPAGRHAIALGRAVSSHNTRQTAFNQANGYTRIVYGSDGKPLLNSDGTEVTERVEPDVRMTQFWLKTRERFSERIEISGPGGGPIKSQDMTLDERKKKLNRLREFLKDTDDEHEEEG
jgi:hypothetical protein